MTQFMEKYHQDKISIIHPDLVVKNYQSFGLENIHDVDCGDFLRKLLHEMAKESEHLETTPKVKENAFIHIEWKFECPSCNRFLSMQIKDYVLKIQIWDEKCLEELLQDLLYRKKCPCGQLCKVEPSLKHLGQYLFIEVDRALISSGKNLAFSRIFSLVKKHNFFEWIFLGHQIRV